MTLKLTKAECRRLAHWLQQTLTCGVSYQETQTHNALIPIYHKLQKGAGIEFVIPHKIRDWKTDVKLCEHGEIK